MKYTEIEPGVWRIEGSKDVNRFKRSISFLNKRENRNKNLWIIRHKDVCPMEEGFRYIVDPTHIGIATGVQCKSCKEEFDITDYGVW